MADLRIGVIGAGGRGGLATHAHKPGHGARIAAVCDIRTEVLQDCRAAYGEDILTTDSPDVLLGQDLDAVFVCSPDYLHRSHAGAALEAGVAVYLEKPMGITIAECDEILRLAAHGRTKLYLGHNMRHMDFVVTMKKLIADGAIGEVQTAWCRHFVGHGGDFYFKDWHADRRLSTGMLLQKATHDIDVLHWLCSGYSRRVHAMGTLAVYGRVGNRLSEPGPRPRHSLDHWPPLAQTGLHPIVDIEDISMMQMELDNGVLACYQQCHFTPDYWRNYTVIGTEGRIENFGNGEEGTVIKIWNRRRSGYDAAGDIEIPMQPLSGGHGGADPRIVDEFLGFVRGETVPRTSPVEARHSVAAGCCATDSLRHGGIPVDVPDVAPDIAEFFAPTI